MNLFNALLTREAREQLNLVLVAFLAVPALVIGLQLGVVGESPYSHEMVALWIIPGGVVLMMLALILDSTTRDAGSDMGASLERLPVRRGSLLAAKFAWLGAVGVALLAWTYLVEALCAFQRGGMPAPVDFHWVSARHLSGYVAMGASLLLMTSLGLWIGRTFVAGAVFLAVMGVLAAAFKANEGALRALPEVLPRELVFLGLPLCLLLAGLVCYRPGYALPRESLRRGVLFLGLVGFPTGGVVLAQWQGHELASMPSTGGGRARYAELSPDETQLRVDIDGYYESLLGGKAWAYGTLVLDTSSWELEFRAGRKYYFHHWAQSGEPVLAEVGGGGPSRVFSRAEGKPHRLPQLAPVASKVLYRYEVSDEGVVSRRAAGGEMAEFCRLPQLEEVSYLTVQADPGGEYLFVTSWRGGPVGRPKLGGTYLAASTGRVLQVLPWGWSHGQWGKRPDWIATAVRQFRGSAEVRTHAIMLVGEQTLSEVPVPGYGSTSVLANGNLIHLSGGHILLLDPNGKQLRVIYAPEPMGDIL